MQTRTEIIHLHENSYGYRVYLDEVLCIVQDTMPGAPGFTTMSAAEAELHAEADAAALSEPAQAPSEG